MDAELQFDQVQRPSGSSCGGCQSALLGSYFQANGHVLCEACATNLKNAFQGTNGGFVRFLKSTVFGIGGGLAGGAVYTAVLAFAHINAALVTILIGWLVGKGVSKGNGGRGGTGYQILAVLITYMVIGFSAALSEVLTSDVAEGSLFASIVICVFGAVTGAVVMGISDPLSALITFFGLLQAWKSNKAVQIEVTGPHLLSTPANNGSSNTPPPPPLPSAPPTLPQGA